MQANCIAFEISGDSAVAREAGACIVGDGETTVVLDDGSTINQTRPLARAGFCDSIDCCPP